MFLGIVIFAVLGLVLVGVWFSMGGRRREYESTGDARDELTDEQFRRIEFGDEDI